MNTSAVNFFSDLFCKISLFKLSSGEDRDGRFFFIGCPLLCSATMLMQSCCMRVSLKSTIGSPVFQIFRFNLFFLTLWIFTTIKSNNNIDIDRPYRYFWRYA